MSQQPQGGKVAAGCALVAFFCEKCSLGDKTSAGSQKMARYGR
jgi:hypothetical protein